MKTVTVQMSAHVKAEVSTLCTCWRLTRTDGTVYRWTDHDDDVVFDGDLYVTASGGFDRTAIESLLELDVSNMDLIGYLDQSAFTLNDIRAGLFDAAQMRVFLVNWADPSMGPIDVRWGTLGEVKTTDTGVFKVELRGIQQAYSQTIGRITTPECTANFGDSKCGINLADWTFPGSVVAVTNRRAFTVDISPIGLFNVGIVKFLTGANQGHVVEIFNLNILPPVPADDPIDPDLPRSDVTLKFAVPNAIEPGDTLEVIAGCDQRPETCRDVYHNKVNFRGFDFLPGSNALYKPVGR